MNFEALIADLVDKIDEKERPRGETRHSLARSLALSKATSIESLEAHDLCPATGDQSTAGFEDDVAVGHFKQKLRLDLDYKDLSVSLRTEQSIALETCMLKAQVTTLAEQLAHANSKLDQSHRKIGFLEAQLLIQDEQIRQLKQEQPEGTKKRRATKGRQPR